MKLFDSIDSLSNDLHKATQEKVKKFDLIRGKSAGFPFWDIVVLSALDDAQKKLYEIQLEEKLARKELPTSPKYHVFHDPIGVKVGNGGGVISVMDDLDKIYKEELKTKKVLILLSGGYSQRLPSASLLGKIFTALPLGNPIYQMIEFKLAMYIDFPQRMKPGVFVSSADCIELYELTGDDWNFQNHGVTSLAHPSPIEIGTTHGVYVLDEPVEKIVKEATSKFGGSQCSAFMGKCLRFLHKPSKDVMRSSKAVFMKGSEEFIYSDSAYFMDIETGLLLLDWYRKRDGVRCEIDAYGDFLQALGPQANTEYCNNVKNVTIPLPELVPTRMEIFEVLRETQLNVLMLNKSKFYHIGTTKEYLEHFCEDACFRHEILCTNKALLKSSQPVNNLSEKTVFIHCNVHSVEGVAENVVIEYTNLSRGSSIGESSIVSNNNFPAGLQVPKNSFLHTVVIRTNEEDTPVFVTIAFGTEDNLKKSCSARSEVSMLKYAGLAFNKVLEKLNLPKDPWPEKCELLNLWHAKIFPAFDNAQDAARYGNCMLSVCRSNVQSECLSGDSKKSRCAGGRLFSMADILKLKDIHGFLAMRKELRELILNSNCQA